MQILKDKIVFISGASSGIGKACAIEFAKHGSKLILCARRKERLEKLSQELRSEHKIEIFSFELDVRVKNEVDNCNDTAA